MREHKTVGHPQHRNYNNTNAQACQWVNDRKKICYCHILLWLVRTHLKLYTQCLVGSQSHMRTQFQLSHPSKNVFVSDSHKEWEGGFDKHSPKTDRYFCCKVELLHSLIRLHNSVTKQSWGL